MKILLITGSYPPMKCGVGDYTALLSFHIARCEDVQVAVLTDIRSKKYADDSKVRVFPIVKKWNIFTLHTVIKTICKWRPDLVHIQFPTAGYGNFFMPKLLPVVLKFLKMQVVQTWHEPPQLSYLLNAVTRDTVIVVEPDFKSFVFPPYRGYFLRKRMRHIPIASNIPKTLLSDKDRVAIHKALAGAADYLVAYFGFVSELKGLENIFDIADPQYDRIVLICELSASDPYQSKILEKINKEPWTGKVIVTGFCEPHEVARMLAASDAVVLPFLKGVSQRNGTLLAAKEQGTFILTTHRTRRGYDEAENIFYSAINDVEMMRQALRQYLGRKKTHMDIVADSWNEIAEKHVQLYLEIVKRRTKARFFPTII